MHDRASIAAALRELGALLELTGENSFKVRAYENGAHALEHAEGDLGWLVAEGRLTSLKNIGRALAERITELYTTGHCEQLDRLRDALPPGILELSQVPNLGPKKAMALRDLLGVASVAELKVACAAGLVRGLKGFGEKTEQNLLEGIARWEKRETRMRLEDALLEAERLLAFLRASPAVERAEAAGSLRRWRETVGDLDVIVATRDADGAMARFVDYPAIAKVEARGDTKCTVRLSNGLQVDLRAVAPEDFWTALHHFTGSKAHHVKLRGLARDRGLTISEYGVFRRPPGARDPAEGAPPPVAGEKLPVSSEAELYSHLGLQLVPPELREDVGELELARAGRLPDYLEQSDIQGLVHCHTVYSDGRNTVEEMARAADALGMKYLTITDHSPAAGYAGGLTVDRLKAQWDEIARVQERVKVRLLRGTESDILEDGALDWPDEILEQLDVVIASVHSRLKMDEDAMTRRLVAAMRRPQFKIWGHALGRLIGKRPPFACRVEEVLDAAAESRAAIEVNGDPHRLDMEPRWLREAAKRGLRFVVSVDAHSTAAFDYLRFGVHTARRGGLTRAQVLNTLDVEAFCAAVRPA